MHLVDSHAHLDSDRYDEDRAAMLARAYAAGVHTILAIGLGDGPHEMHRALEIAAEFSGQPAMPTIYASAGIHPQEAHRADAPALTRLAELAANQRCIAIGEIGLDYYHLDNPDVPTQHRAFIAQMEVAAAARLPILLHIRTSELATPQAKEKFGPADAWADTLALLETHWRPTALGGVMHCFSGEVEHARRSLDLGFMLSFAGNLTYPRAQNLRDAAIFAPLDSLLVETDAPFLAPVPNRGQRNEPAWVAHTATRLAAERKLAPEALAEATTANFHRFFVRTRPLA
ncbi:MAG TPA: TatD family hydrolase [Acidobacteriaceae bacterium]